jgi:hypothetical protein
LLSIPNFITYDIESVKYYKEINSSSYQIEESLECIQNYDGLLVNFTQWYSGVVSYFIPSFVLIYCHVKILVFMFKHSKRLSEHVSFQKVGVNLKYFS